MGLLDEVKAQAQYPGPLCTVQEQMAKHKKIADEIAACIKDRSLPISAVGRAFLARSIEISANTISRHRQNDCASCRNAGMRW